MRFEVTENQEKCFPKVLKVTLFFGMQKPKASQMSKDCIEQNMDTMNTPLKVKNQEVAQKLPRKIGCHPEEGKN